MKTQTCPECGGAVGYGTHTQTITHKQASSEVELECWKCADCGELMMHSAATLKFSATLQELKRRVANGEARCRARRGERDR